MTTATMTREKINAEMAGALDMLGFKGLEVMLFTDGCWSINGPEQSVAGAVNHLTTYHGLKLDRPIENDAELGAIAFLN